MCRSLFASPDHDRPAINAEGDWESSTGAQRIKKMMDDELTMQSFQQARRRVE
jgi:hypothetical protein